MPGSSLRKRLVDHNETNVWPTGFLCTYYTRVYSVFLGPSGTNLHIRLLFSSLRHHNYSTAAGLIPRGVRAHTYRGQPYTHKCFVRVCMSLQAFSSHYRMPHLSRAHHVYIIFTYVYKSPRSITIGIKDPRPARWRAGEGR